MPPEQLKMNNYDIFTLFGKQRDVIAIASLLRRDGYKGEGVVTPFPKGPRAAPADFGCRRPPKSSSFREHNFNVDRLQRGPQEAQEGFTKIIGVPKLKKRK